MLRALAGLLVGLLVGLTGVGGGSLMAPILILLVGVAPSVAVGTDLWFAAITKTVGGVVHHKYGKPDWMIVCHLLMGSLPASVATIAVLSNMDIDRVQSGFIIKALGVLLLLTALATLMRRLIHDAAKKLNPPTAKRAKQVQPVLTVLAGALLGVMVTLTSVGAGALGATMLIMLYPLRMKAARLVGTDIIHAVPLTAVAGLGHLVIGNVDFTLLVSLLVGSIPGIIVGSLLASRIPDKLVRSALATILVVVGVRLLI
jgi:uncharacterized membrane protein YfcA